MAVTAANFLQDFPEFAADPASYPVPAITHWLSIAKLLLNSPPWDDSPGDDGRSILDLGKELFCAHWITLSKRAKDAVNRGGSPGIATGMVSAKSVGPISQSFDTASIMRKDATHWNLTTYGIQYIHFVDLFGAGPIQVGIGFDPLGDFNGPAWVGPWPWPSITGFS